MRLRITVAFPVILILAGLMGCNPIERRAEKTKKSPLPILSQSVQQPRLVWSNHDGKGAGKLEAKLRLGISKDEIFSVDYRGKLIAFDRLTGRTRWKAATETPVTAGVGVTDKAVVIGTEMGKIEALSIENGQSLWKAVVESPVMVFSEGRSIVCAHAANDSVYAFNSTDGRELWHYQVNTPPLMFRQVSRPVIAGNKVLVGFSTGKLMALDRATGFPEWEKEIAVSKGRSDIQRMVDVSAEPVVVGKTVYAVGYQGRVVALDIDTGTSLWERDLSSFAGLAVNTASVFVSDAAGTVWALKRNSGEVVWKQEGLLGRALTAPVVMNHEIVVADEEGYLHWFNESDGSFTGRVRVDSKGIEATPVVEEGYLSVLGRSGKIETYTREKQ
jgi:outer membrane protein assembly factor BamB